MGEQLSAGADVDAGAGADKGLSAGTGRGPGRPRDEELDERIFAATLRLVDAGERVTVSRVVAESGVSRSALYRRWPSLTGLIAAALDNGRVVPTVVRAGRDLKEALTEALLGAAGDSAAHEARFRERIRLVMADPQLQREYWASHVARRRVPIEEAISAGVESGELRADLDVSACFDAIVGSMYYQYVVRGETLRHGPAQERVRHALDIIWRGMIAEAGRAQCDSSPGRDRGHSGPISVEGIGPE